MADSSAAEAAAAAVSPSDFFTLPDAAGLPVTLPARLGPSLGAELVGWLDAYARQVFLYGRAWDCVLRAIHISDEAIMPQILAIDFFIAKNDIVNAGRSLAQAKLLYRSQSSVLTARESLYLRGYSCMLDNQLRASLQAFQSVLDLAPGDLFAVKKVQLLAFVLGGREEMLAVVQRPAVEEACKDRPYFHAMKAFALEENERFAEANTAVAKGLLLEPHDPWAIHVRAHLFYAAGGSMALYARPLPTDTSSVSESGCTVDGSAWLESHADEWGQCMSFLYVHCWFHDALLRLDLDQMERTQSIFDQHVWPFKGADDPAHAAAVAASAAAASSSSSSSSLSALDVAGETSFGVPCTSLSFQRNDRFYVEDQNGAINLLWRMELRTAGAGRPQATDAVAGEKHESASTAASTAEQKQQRLDSAAAGSSSSASPASVFSLHAPAFESRWRSIVSCLTLPPTQGLSLFGLLQLYALCRCGRLAEAKQVVDLYTADVSAVADGDRRAALEGVLLPIARAIYAYHSAADAADGVAQAWALMHQMLVLGPAAAESTSGAAVNSEALGVSAGSSVANPSGAPAAASAASSAARPLRPASAARLGCLAASGEQLEVLVEWYLELCAAAGKWAELQYALTDKLAVRGGVQWYQRLSAIAQAKRKEDRR